MNNSISIIFLYGTKETDLQLHGKTRSFCYMATQYKHRDRLHQRAKEEGFRSRAAYKLMEIDDKFHVLGTSARVLDLGCWPGGWLQVANNKVGTNGVIVGIDLVKTASLPNSNVHVLVGNANEESILEQALLLGAGCFDVVLSDMSPKLTGIKEQDHQTALMCAEMALDICKKVLKPKGNVVIKLFKSGEAETFVRTSRQFFSRIARSELDSTRKTSNEFYMIGLGFSPQPR